MIRKSTINLNYANQNKLDILSNIIEEYQIVVNYYINYIWPNLKFFGSYVTDINHCNSWFSSRLKRCAAQHALAICKSQIKKRRKTIPLYKSNTMELTELIGKFEFDKNSFDIWLTLTSIGRKIKLVLPSKKHNHFNKLLSSGFVLKKSFRIRKINNNYFCDLFFEKDKPITRAKGRVIGLDIGYKKLAVTSDGYSFGLRIEEICNRISNKVRNSKNYKGALETRNNYINKITKELLNFHSNIKKIVIEDLKLLKHKSKFSKKFNNKFQYWTYSKFISRLNMNAEELGVLVTRVHPAYTSQTCNKCKFINKESRNREIYECSNCGRVFDADHNAALNILFKSRYEHNIVAHLTKTNIFI